MVTFTDLREADTKALEAAGQAWRDHADSLRELTERMNTKVASALLRSGWRGDAATVATSRSENIEDYFDIRSHAAELAASVYESAYERLWRLRWRLTVAVDSAYAAGLSVREDGVVEPPPPTAVELHDPDGEALVGQRARRARELTEQIAGVVCEADAVDDQTAAALDRLRPDSNLFGGAGWGELAMDAGGLAAAHGLSEDDIPHRNPDAAGAWWDRLSQTQQTLYLMAYPDLIGALDGLPVEARDRANRLALHNALSMRGGVVDDRNRVLLERLQQSEHWPPAQRLHLLEFDLAADGQAVLAIGNPDTADHTAVYVPGVGTTIDNIGGDVTRARDLQAEADRLTVGKTGDVATVMWLGYDTPGVDLSAIRGHHAEAGAPELDSFIDGLRVSHDGDPGQLSVVGYSYGSTVVGEAASAGDGLAVDDIIVAGSPGMRVDGVADLQMAPEHVWAGAAEGDAVSGWLSHFAHGPEPHKDDFGGNRFEVDTTGHSDYWRTSTDSLKNQARIVVGHYDRVGLEHGEPPR